MGRQVKPQVTPTPRRSPCETPQEKSQGTPEIEISVTPQGTPPDIEISIEPEKDLQYVSEIIMVYNSTYYYFNIVLLPILYHFQQTCKALHIK